MLKCTNCSMLLFNIIESHLQVTGNTAGEDASCAVPQFTSRTRWNHSSFPVSPLSFSYLHPFPFHLSFLFLSLTPSFHPSSLLLNQKYSPLSFFYPPLRLTVSASLFPSAAPFPDHLIPPSLRPCYLIPVSLLQQTPSSFSHPLMSISLPIMSPSTPFLFDP